MASESRLQGYLRRAEEAERQQMRAKTPEARRAWERIAASYLELAELKRLNGRLSRLGKARFHVGGHLAAGLRRLTRELIQFAGDR